MVQPERLLHTLITLLRIDSPSGEEGEIGRHLAGRLAEMGLRSEIDGIGNVIARMEGEGAPFLLTAHMDNVMPCRGVVPVVEDGVIRSNGKTVLGADDKAGVAVILEVLSTILDEGIPHRPLEIAITVQEETGLDGAKALDKGKLRAKLGIGLDAGGGPGTIIVSAPSHDIISAVVRGKAAHAGVHPEEGISAIVIAAEAISNMQLGRIDFETTANVGTLHGGTATNVIPECVELKAEARSHSEEKLSAQTASMVSALECATNSHGGAIDIEVERAYSSYEFTECDRIVGLIMDRMNALGIEPSLVPTGGGSDANIFNAAGIEVVNIGIGMAKSHGVEEYIALADMITATEILLACLSPS